MSLLVNKSSLRFSFGKGTSGYTVKNLAIWERTQWLLGFLLDSSAHKCVGEEKRFPHSLKVPAESERPPCHHEDRQHSYSSLQSSRVGLVSPLFCEPIPRITSSSMENHVSFYFSKSSCLGCLFALWCTGILGHIVSSWDMLKSYPLLT